MGNVSSIFVVFTKVMYFRFHPEVIKESVIQFLLDNGESCFPQRFTTTSFIDYLSLYGDLAVSYLLGWNSRSMAKPFLEVLSGKARSLPGSLASRSLPAEVGNRERPAVGFVLYAVWLK